MLINQDGTIDNETNTVLTMSNLMIELDDNQYFQITPTGKRLELWNGKKEYLDKKDPHCVSRRVTYWNMKSVVGFFFRKYN
jgi:hypothetical protein